MSKPYEMTGTPEANSGTRILSIQEVAQMMNRSPFMQEAVERINRFEGKPRMIQKVIHEDREKNLTRVLNNAYQIKAQQKKVMA